MRTRYLLFTLVFIALPAFVYGAPYQHEAGIAYLKAQPQTIWTTMALSHVGETNRDTSYLDAVECSGTDYAPVTACSGYILAIAAQGGDPHNFKEKNFIEKLIVLYEKADAEESLTLADAEFALLALRSAGEDVSHEQVQKSIGFLREHQQADGGFPFADGFSSDVDITAMAVMALVSADVSSQDPAIMNANAFVNSQQNTDGGFHSAWDAVSNANSTAWALSMIYALSDDPQNGIWKEEGGEPQLFLESLETGEGWFEYQEGAGNFLPTDTTAQVVIALAGGFYPVKTFIEEQESLMVAPVIPGVDVSQEPAEENQEDIPDEPLPDEKEDANTYDTQEETADSPAPVAVQKPQEFPDGTLVKILDSEGSNEESHGIVYLIEGGRKRWIPSEDILKTQFMGQMVHFVAEEDIAHIPEGLRVVYYNSIYVRSEATGRIYQIHKGKKYHVLSLEAWQTLQKEGAQLSDITDAELMLYEMGGVIL